MSSVGPTPSSSRRRSHGGSADDVSIICYTSGTTGNPKGVMLTHGNATAIADAFRRAEDVRPEDASLAYLPMAWAGDTVYTLFLSLAVGFAANCPESPETVQRDLRELGPTTVLAPPRIWESMLTAIQVKSADAPALKRWVFERFRAGRRARGDPAVRGKPVPRRAPARLRPRRVLRVRSRARPARAAPGQVGAHGRGAARSRYLSVLSGLRRQSEASVRLHRNDGARVPSARRGGQPHHGRPPVSRASR